MNKKELPKVEEEKAEPTLKELVDADLDEVVGGAGTEAARVAAKGSRKK
jgi:ribosomal protein L12E/L44/L45/RPP1/RPP2